jgi:type I restriction enzyme S subunit
VKRQWEQKELGKLAELKGRIGWRGLTAKEYTKTGPLFLSVHSLNHGDYVDFRDAFHISEQRYAESPEIMLQEDDVLICKDGAGIGKVGIVGKLPGKTTINSSLLLIRSGKCILPKFLYRCLSSPYFQEIVNSRLNGATTPHLYQRDITEFPIHLPPLPEQQRIVGILDETFDGVATARTNTEKNLQNARALFASHLQAVFTNREEDWLGKPLGALATFRNGINYTQNSKGDRVKVVGVKDFQKSFWVPSQDLDTVTIDGKLSELDLLRQGDILAVRSNGNAQLIGRCIVAGSVPERMSHSGFTIRIRLSNGEILPEYLGHFMKSAGSRKRLIEGGTGTNIKSLNQQTLAALEVPYPPVLKQRTLVTKLELISEEIKRLEAIYLQKLAALEDLKKSLLHEAFSGQL